jgi:hypothetical protein
MRPVGLARLCALCLAAAAPADALGRLRDEMASWRRDVEDFGIVVEE